MNGNDILKQELSDLSGTLPSAVLMEAPDDPLVLQTAEPASLDSTSPIPMLPIQPGEIASEAIELKNPCVVNGVNKNAMTAGANGVPLDQFLKNNFNIIIIILLGVIVLRGR